MTELQRLRSAIESDDGSLSEAEIDRYVNLVAAARAPSARLSSGSLDSGASQAARERGRERIANALRKYRSG